MNDTVGTIGMFAEVEQPKKNMKRVDVRLPGEVVHHLEEYAMLLGVSTSEVVRWMVIYGLEQRRFR